MTIRNAFDVAARAERAERSSASPGRALVVAWCVVSACAPASPECGATAVDDGCAGSLDVQPVDPVTFTVRDASLAPASASVARVVACNPGGATPDGVALEAEPVWRVEGVEEALALGLVYGSTPAGAVVVVEPTAVVDGDSYRVELGTVDGRGSDRWNVWFTAGSAQSVGAVADSPCPPGW